MTNIEYIWRVNGSDIFYTPETNGGGDHFFPEYLDLVIQYYGRVHHQELLPSPIHESYHEILHVLQYDRDVSSHHLYLLVRLSMQCPHLYVHATTPVIVGASDPLC